MLNVKKIQLNTGYQNQLNTGYLSELKNCYNWTLYDVREDAYYLVRINYSYYMQETSE